MEFEWDEEKNRKNIKNMVLALSLLLRFSSMMTG